MHSTDDTALSGNLDQPHAILTTDEAARQLRVSPKTMAYWRQTGDGPAFMRLGSRTVRYRADDLAAYMNGRRRQNTVEVPTRR